MAALPLAPISPVSTSLVGNLTYGAQVVPMRGTNGFTSLLTNGVEGVNANLLNADKLAHDFALNDAMPVHQVTYALEQARLSLNLMMQVRNRLVESYQQLMNMQL